MRSIRLIALMACALVVPTTLAEEWFAWEWDSEPGQKWSMDRDLRIITILQPGSYRFYATLDSENGPLADIQNITAPGVSGTITVSIIREGGANLPGCTELAKMDLTGATTSNVGEVRIAGDAGTAGPITFGQLNDNAPFVADDVLDTLTIGTLRGTVDCNSLRDFTTTTGLGSPVIDVAEPYASAMVINGSDTLGALTLAGVAATGTVTRGAGSTGTVTIQGDMAGTLEFNGGIVQITSLTLDSLSGSVNLPYVGAGGVTINGDVSGSLQVRGSSGASEILGNITATGSVLFQGDVNNHLYIGTDTGGGNVDGTLEVRGDITGTPRELRCHGSVNGTLTTGTTQGTSNMLFHLQIDKDVLGVINIRENLNPQNGLGSVRILGSLGSPTDPGFITVGGIQVQSPYTAYICINYDGLDCAEDADDFWYAGSKITVGATEYTGPNHTARVHAVPPSGGPGDCNGDHVVTFGDIDPFVGLLFNSDDMPGFHTAHLFMADTSGDNAVTFADIDPFVDLLGAIYCQDQLMMMGASASTGGGTDPQTVASFLAANVSAANYDTLLDAVAYVATFPPVDASTDWAQVAALLSGE